MLYGRPNYGPQLIPNIGVLKYKMTLIQMDNKQIQSELRSEWLSSSYRQAAMKEWEYRQLEELYARESSNG